MEHPNVKGYDYEKVREKMLRSWGKTIQSIRVTLKRNSLKLKINLLK